MTQELLRNHNFILKLTVTADESDDTLAVSAVKLYEGKHRLDDSAGLTVAFAGGSAATTCSVQFGTILPPITEIQLVATFQA